LRYVWYNIEELPDSKPADAGAGVLFIIIALSSNPAEPVSGPAYSVVRRPIINPIMIRIGSMSSGIQKIS